MSFTSKMTSNEISATRDKLTPLDQATLKRIEIAEQFTIGSLWLTGGVVWHNNEEGELRSVCCRGTPIWATQEVIAKMLNIKLAP